MKKLLLISGIIWTNALIAQTTEYLFNLQSGFFSFRGREAAKVTAIIQEDVVGYPNTTMNHYGKKPGFSYSIEAGIQRITRPAWLYGFGIAFESLQSKVDIDKIFSFRGSEDASGRTKLANKFININPYFGKRIIGKKLLMDLSTGIDIGFCLSSHENGFATSITDNYVETDTDRAKPEVDIRPRIQLAAYCQKFGLLLGYSYGMTNYYGHLMGSDPEAFSRFLRIGILYRVN